MTAFLKGWIEVRGQKVLPKEAISRFQGNPLAASDFGGEFCLCVDDCTARDYLGIIPGDTPPGEIVCAGEVIGKVDPCLTPVDLDTAICEAVRLRSDMGVVALSGGVDSALVAALAELPCVSVGMAGSHDLKMADKAARNLGLDCTLTTIETGEIEGALRAVITTIPRITPLDVAIATTQYFITRSAMEQGHTRVLTGQGADELFAGYARYLSVEDVNIQLAMDFSSLRLQGDRDQSVAALHRVLLSMPYLDLRVVRVAEALPAHRKVTGNLRKIALREVAARHLPIELAMADKKAMQYGSGVWKAIQRLAKRSGFKGVGEYLAAISR